MLSPSCSNYITLSNPHNSVWQLYFFQSETFFF